MAGKVFIIMTLNLVLLQQEGVLAVGLCNNVICGSNLEICYDNGSQAACICKPGYYKAKSKGTCESDCDMYHCYYGAKCERGPEGRMCRCPAGYSGTRCGQMKGISIPITVGASIAAFVLIVFMVVIFTKNGRKNSGSKSRWAEIDAENRKIESSQQKANDSSDMRKNETTSEVSNENEEIFIEVADTKKDSVSGMSFTNEVAERSVEEDEQVNEEDSAL